MLVTITYPEGPMSASYVGGAYIELSFGTEGYAPTEVINVWDYETGRALPPFDRWPELTDEVRRSCLRSEVRAWGRMLEDDGWDDWYADYVRNKR